VVLTIDANIQYIAEKELSRAIAETHALHGSVVIQDPSTGELLAIANWPTFDPNNAGSYPDEVRMDRAVSAAYEPGSTFKVITMTSAIEHHVASPDDLIDCQMGSIRMPGRVIHDWKKFGLLTVRQVLEHSSGVGAIKIALRVGAPRFYETIRQFGIGEPTGILLPGENRGLLRPLENWTASSIGSLAMGQEVSVTPIQIISAISAIANGGTLYRPRIVREVKGGVQSVLLPGSDPTQATDPKTAATVREMMEDVVLEGTGKKAQLDGYTAAGKSGTAQLIDPATGRYSRTRYNASFVGFAPVNDPAVTILVVLDSPEGEHHGGDVGGPVFRRIAEQLLAYLDVPHDLPSPMDREVAKNSAGSKRAASRAVAKRDTTEAHFKSAIARTNEMRSPTVAFGSDAAIVPDLRGQTVRGVTQACSRLGLVPALIGSGVALEQFPAAGTSVLRGGRLTVRFGRPETEASARGRAN
jgi:cell division protein FtsI/penicillin-binding protein 2